MSGSDQRFFAEFEPYTQAISARLVGLVAGLGEPLRSLAMPLASNYDAKAWTHPYSFPLAYLPLWMLHGAEALEGDALDAMAVDCGYATNCGYLYIRLQDDVYDEPADMGQARMLLVGNELIRECFCGFQQWFSPESMFWSSFRGYWEEFSQATLWEMEHHLGHFEAFDSGDVIRQGRKLSLAKAPCAAVALHLGLRSRLPEIEMAVEYLQAANQLANDIAGLVRDIDARNITYPLTLATGPDFDWEGPDRRERALAAVMQSRAMEETFLLAISLHAEALARMDGLASPHFDEFVAWRRGFLSAGLNDYAGIKMAGLLGFADPSTERVDLPQSQD